MTQNKAKRKYLQICGAGLSKASAPQTVSSPVAFPTPAARMVAAISETWLEAAKTRRQHDRRTSGAVLFRAAND